MDSLYSADVLSNQYKIIYQEFLNISDTLNAFAYQGIRAFNNAKTDSIAKIRQHYQYKGLLNIIDNYPIFATTYLVKKDGDSISYAEGYKRASHFWDLRNQAMTKHILHFIEEYKGAKIVVLNGYFHRYYLNALIKPHQDTHNFIIKEFYE